MKKLALNIVWLPLALASFHLLQDPEPTPAPAEGLTQTEEAIELIDKKIGFHAGRAARSPNSWLDLEQVAGAYLGRAHLTGSYDDYAQADRAVREAFERAPEGSGPFFVRARISFTLHRFAEVEPDLARIESSILVKSDVQRAVDELRAALAYQRGDYAGSAMEFHRLLAEKKTATGLVRAAQYQWKSGDFDGAEKMFAEALTMTRPADLERRAWLSLMRGLMDLDRGRLDDALTHYQLADRTFGGWYLIEEHIAEIKALKGQHEEARHRYETLVAKTNNPEFMDALAEVYNELHRPSDEAQMVDRAHALYEARLLRFPKAAFGHALDHYLDREDAQRAIELGEKNRDLRPNAEAFVKLAQAYRLSGRTQQAKQAIEHALATPISTAELHGTAADIYASLGEQGQAQIQQQRAHSINPNWR